MFSGIGGLETGVINALGKKNVDIVFSSEIDVHATQAYQSIYKHSPVGDIREVKEENVPDHDILLGGFPCQAFSLSGLRLGFKDTRGTLFFEIARIAKYKKPKYMILENVKGLLSHDDGRTFEVIKSTLDEIGYYFHFKVFNSKFFNIPQNRERIYIVCFRKDLKKEFDEFVLPQNKKLTKKITDILEDKVDSKFYVSEHKKKNLIKQMESDCFKRKDTFLIDDQGRRLKILKPLDVCPTIRREMHGNEPKVVYVTSEGFEIRRLTPLECLRLQGFPDSYYKSMKSVGISDSQIYKMAGNAVTTKVPEAIAKRLFKK